MGLIILGLGNLLLADDGVGVHAARALESEPPTGAVVREIGTSVFDAVPLLDGATRVIAIDAVDAGHPPGTVVRFDVDAGEQRPSPASLHELDIPALVRSMPAGRRPLVTVVGIQPAVIEPGTELSPVVRAALPLLLREVRALARSHVLLDTPPTREW